MNLHSIIKNRKISREYFKKNVPDEIIDKIVDAGIWGPSLVGMQPWEFLLIKNKPKISKIARLMKIKSDEISFGKNFIKTISATVENSQALIAVYNTCDLSKRVQNDNLLYKVVKLSEIQAIAAAIQNMVLAANYLGVGICWLSMPVMCEDQINKLLMTDHQLVAILTLGYAKDNIKRAGRKKIEQIYHKIR